MNDERGFTLVELLVSLAILTIADRIAVERANLAMRVSLILTDQRGEVGIENRRRQSAGRHEMEVARHIGRIEVPEKCLRPRRLASQAG